VNKKYLITIERIHTEQHQMILEGISSVDALDQARSLVEVRNTKCPVGTIFSIKKVEEVKDE
jgi:hypothetical protein